MDIAHLQAASQLYSQRSKICNRYASLGNLNGSSKHFTTRSNPKYVCSKKCTIKSVNREKGIKENIPNIKRRRILRNCLEMESQPPKKKSLWGI